MPTDLTVTLEDRPGTLAAACEALGEAGINIEGCCAYRHEGASRLHVLVEDPTAARAALADAGYDVIGERDVVVVELEDRPGTAGETLARIAAAGVSLDLVYIGTRTRLVVGAEELDKVRAAV